MAWMQLAASVLGSIYANKQAKKAQNSANQNADWAFGQSGMQDYKGLFGGYNAESGEYLNKDMQGRMDSYFNRADATGAQIGNYSPEEYAQNMYDMDLKMLNPELQQQSAAQEARLLAQGRLGSTGGAGAQGGLMQAQNMTRLGLRRDSYNKSQFQLDNMRRRQQEDMSMGLGFGGLTQQYASNAYSQAQLRGNNAWRAANMKSGAATARAGANSTGMTGLMKSFGKMNFGGKTVAPATDQMGPSNRGGQRDGGTPYIAPPAFPSPGGGFNGGERFGGGITDMRARREDELLGGGGITDMRARAPWELQMNNRYS